MQLVDPKWKEIGVSKRGRRLFVKLPYTTVSALLQEIIELGPREGKLEELYTWLRNELSQGRGYVLVFSMSTTEAMQDINLLSGMDTPVSQAYCQALWKGLDANKEVDWISRVEKQAPAGGENRGTSGEASGLASDRGSSSSGFLLHEQGDLSGHLHPELGQLRDLPSWTAEDLRYSRTLSQPTARSEERRSFVTYFRVAVLAAAGALLYTCVS